MQEIDSPDFRSLEVCISVTVVDLCSFEFNWIEFMSLVDCKPALILIVGTLLSLEISLYMSGDSVYSH